MTKLGWTRRNYLSRALGAVTALSILHGTAALAADPLKIGFSMALTGGLAGNGKAALMAMNMWAEKVNAAGGLLNRPVQLVYYDDQSNPTTVPGIYTKLIGVDKVDLVVSPYGTNLIAPAMPIVMAKQLAFMSLFGVGVNEQFHYDRYFQIMPMGPKANETIAEAFFSVAKDIKPAPKSVAIVGADAEFGKINTDAARDIAKKLGLKITYDRSYPPTTVDFSPIVRAIQASSPDLVFIASYPTDTVGLIRSINEIGLKPQLMGGGAVGLQYAAIKTQLGPQINNLLGYELYVPAKTVSNPGIEQFLQVYQAKAAEQGVDPLGYYVPPFVYAAMEVLEQAVKKTGGVDQKAIAEAMRTGTFKTVVGDIKFAPNGEWDKARVLMVQYTGVTGNGLDQFRGPEHYSVLYPPEVKTAEPVTPFR